ncbi:MULTISPECIES: molybdopterin-dependent oxidoreductase [unclassified Helicobacter]|uniref:molybdopterin-dependent oxidoreductase n=1 Tax=unclassified Helicobacter TaxID=2593540 RepID=UPI000CF102DC|nr:MULTISPECIES: molybdopterin-dependent oxidoreductase [unclassified Helicobacter]
MAISRRNILKFTTGSVLGLHLQPLHSAGIFRKIEKIPHATHFGPFYAKVEDGIFKDIEAQKHDFNPSVTIKALIDQTYSDTRVKYPCVRKSYLENKENHKSLRGREEFVRVSWEEALDLIAKKLKEIPNHNIYNASYSAWKHTGRLHNPSIVASRFFNLALGGVIETNGGYSNDAASKVNPTIIGDMEVYAPQTTHEEIIENCRVYVLWGSDLFKNNRVDYVVANHLNDTYYPQYKKAGIKFICIDPIYTETAEMFEAEWIKIKPNTDVALMLGMMHHLYHTKKYNKTFISKYTDGFETFLPYLLGKTDKIAKTPEWAEQITQIPSKKIKELANLFVSTRTFLAGNWSMQRSSHGEQVDWALITLACMIGQIGLPGGGFGLSMHFLGGGQAVSGYKIQSPLIQGYNKTQLRIPASRISDAILNPNKEINFNGKKIKYPKIDLMYICGSSLVNHQPNTNELIKALRTLDTIIVHDPWWTPTAKMADIVLPSTTTFERDDISFGSFHSKSVIYAMKKVINPLYESKSDFEIFELLSQKIGGEDLRQNYTESKTNSEWLQEFYNQGDGPSFKDFDQFWKDGFVEFEIPKEARHYVRYSDFRKDPIKYKLATESGKIQIFSKIFSSFNLADFKGHPIWFKPKEWLETKSKDNKFHLLSPHSKYRFNSQLDNTWIRNLYKIQGREPMMINPEDATRLDIANGEIVEVYNNEGRILVGAVITSKIRKGVIAICAGSWYDPENPQEENPRCNSGCVNVLTSSNTTSQMAQAIAVNSTLVNIKKLDAGEVIRPYHSILPPSIIGG